MRPSVSWASAAVALSAAAASSAAMALPASRWSHSALPRASCACAGLWASPLMMVEQKIVAIPKRDNLVTACSFRAHRGPHVFRPNRAGRALILFRPKHRRLQIDIRRRQPGDAEQRARERKHEVRGEAEGEQPRRRRVLAEE